MSMYIDIPPNRTEIYMSYADYSTHVVRHRRQIVGSPDDLPSSIGKTGHGDKCACAESSPAIAPTSQSQSDDDLDLDAWAQVSLLETYLQAGPLGIHTSFGIPLCRSVLGNDANNSNFPSSSIGAPDSEEQQCKIAEQLLKTSSERYAGRLVGTATRDRDASQEPCAICDAFLDHLVRFQVEDNGTLQALLRLRDLHIQQSAARQMEAKRKGKHTAELSKLQAKLATANEMINAQHETARQLRDELCDAKTEAAVAKAHVADMKAEQGKILKQLEQLEAQVREGQATIERMTAEIASYKGLAKETQDHQLLLQDDLRPRKRRAVFSSTAAVSRIPLDAPITPTFLPTSADIQHDNWMNMKKPSWKEPPELLAQWMQFNEVQNIRGVPIQGPDWIVDLRDVRGLHRVMAIVSSSRHQKQLLRAVIRLLVVPREYSRLLDVMGLRVAGVSSWLSPPTLPHPPPFTNQDVAWLLAAASVSRADADDWWQFALNYTLAQSAASNTPPETAMEISTLLNRVRQMVDERGRPPGMRDQSDDRYLRNNIPWKRRRQQL